MSDYILNFDGSCGPTNPGPTAGYGFFVKKDGTGMTAISGSLVDSTFSNNYAEFYALYKGLEYIKSHIKPSDKLFIRGDSQLVINVMRGKWRGNPDKIYFPAFVLAQKELTSIRSQRIPVSIDWVPREMNEEADELSTAYSNTSGENS